jgi:hypothetical protein
VRKRFGVDACSRVALVRVVQARGVVGASLVGLRGANRLLRSVRAELDET